MSGAVEIVLIMAAVGYLLVPRVLGEPARATRMLMLPGVLSLIGLSDVWPPIPGLLSDRMEHSSEPTPQPPSLTMGTRSS